MSRRGTTLVEAAVFSLVALVVVVAVFQIYRDAQRELVKTNVHLRGLQAAHQLLERLRLDLKGAVAFQPAGAATAARVRVPAPGVLELFHHELDPDKAQPVPPDAGGLHFLRVNEVRYSFDPATHRVARQEAGGAVQLLAAASFRAVGFQRTGDLLEVSLEWVPEELLAHPAAQQGEVLAVRVLLGLEAEARAEQHPARIVNPTSMFQPASLDAAPGGDRP